MTDQLKNILLIRTDRIGDVVLTTPVASVLHQKIPNVRVSFLTRAYTAELLKYHQDIDEVLVYNPDGKHNGIRGMWRLSRQLAAKNFDAAILFYPRLELAMAIRLAKIPLRIGSGYRGYSFLLNRRIYEHRKHGQKHELDYNFSLLSSLNINPQGPVIFNFSLSPQLISWWNESSAKLKIGTKYAIIHAGSGGSAPNLVFDQYCALISHILQNSDLQIVLTGDESEKAFNEKFISRFQGKHIINLAGQFSLEQLMAVINKSRLFISSSTGPLHIANAFNIPILAFYCPAAPCSPKRWGPYNQQQWVMVPKVTPCKSCIMEKCPHGNCLEKIKTREMIIKLEELLSLISTPE